MVAWHGESPTNSPSRATFIPSTHNPIHTMDNATVINPWQHQVTFDPSWHSQDLEVTLPAISVLAAFHSLPLAAKGIQFGRGRGPVTYLNQAFNRRLTAAKWLELIRPVADQIKSAR